MLRDRRILITGGARGLGASSPSRLGAGARVAIATFSKTTAAPRPEISGRRRCPSTLARPASIERAPERPAKPRRPRRPGEQRRDHQLRRKTLDELDVEVWDRVMTVNVRGTWLMTRAAAPHLRAAGAGRVINIALRPRLWGAPRLLAYVASKGAVIAMTSRCARARSDRITVTRSRPA